MKLDHVFSRNFHTTCQKCQPGQFCFWWFLKMPFRSAALKDFFNIYYHQPVLLAFLQLTEIQVLTFQQVSEKQRVISWIWKFFVHVRALLPIFVMNCKKREVRYIFGSFFCHLWIVPMDWNIAAPLNPWDCLRFTCLAQYLFIYLITHIGFYRPPKCPKWLQAWQAFYLCLLFGVIRSIHWKI